MFLEVEEGGLARDEEADKVYLIRFIANLPLRLYTGSVMSTFNHKIMSSSFKKYP